MATTSFDLSALPRTRAATARRVRDGRVLVGGVLGLLVFATSLGFWNVLAGPRVALAVQRDIPAGVPLTESDLATTRVRVDGTLLQQLLGADELPDLVGRRIAEPLHAGELLLRAHLARGVTAGPGMVLAAVPVKVDTGPGAAAQPGGRVRVLATEKRSNGEAVTTVVLPSAEIVEVVQQARSSLLAGGAAQPTGVSEPIVLRVLATDDEAAALARAKAVGTLEVVLVGEQPSDDASQPSPSRER